MKLHDNTILVTGGASGIGLALTRAFHARGNRVIVCGRREENLEALRRELPDVSAYACDLSDPASTQALADSVLVEHPGINVLVNNAGVQFQGAWTDGTDLAPRIREEVTVNLVAPMLLTAALLPALARQPGAAVINLTSALALAPKKSAPVYCATKAGMRSFTRAIRYQLDGTGVAVHEVVPPLVDTAMTQGRGKGKISPEAFAREMLAGLEAGREEILVDRTRILHALHRVSPGTVRRLMKAA